MEVLYRCCAGLDVHKKVVVACVLGPSRRQEIRQFDTTSSDLKQLAEWLQVRGCTHVAMESTGVYWKPIYQVLESSLQLLLVNARDIKNVPGRKTDIADCEWIAQRRRHGLLRAVLFPPGRFVNCVT